MVEGVGFPLGQYRRSLVSFIIHRADHSPLAEGRQKVGTRTKDRCCCGRRSEYAQERSAAIERSGLSDGGISFGRGIPWPRSCKQDRLPCARCRSRWHVRNSAPAPIKGFGLQDSRYFHHCPRRQRFRSGGGASGLRCISAQAVPGRLFDQCHQQCLGRLRSRVITEQRQRQELQSASALHGLIP